MKNYLFLFLIIVGCNKATQNTLKSKKENPTVKFYDSDKIEHFYLNISEESVHDLIGVERNKDEKNLLHLLIGQYPDSISEPNFETDLVAKYKFIKTELNDAKKKEVEKIFSENNSERAVFSMCLPYYRDVFIFKKNDSIVGIAKVCFGCGESRFLGSKADTGNFGISSELRKLYKIIRNE